MWLKDEGYVITSIHEPLSFRRRSGTANIHAEENFRKVHTEEAVIKLKEMGLSLFRIHFHKGMGYEMERGEREQARELIKLCHKHGIKAQVYIQFGSLMPETYRAEEPDYDNWYSRDERGNPITVWYDQQSFRDRPCLSRPGYWEHLKKIIKEAIVDCQADVIGFDNVSGEMEPEVCHCDACKKEFVEFLKKRYPTKASATERFGHPSVAYIKPPVWNYYTNHYNLTEIKNPVIQEWIEFRAFSKKRRVDELYQICKSYNPDIAVEINAFKQTGQNTTFHFGLYVDDFVNGCDAFWGESEPEIGYKDGVLNHKVRAYKKTQSLDKLLFTGHAWDGSPGMIDKYQLAIAEGMVFHYGIVNCLGLIGNIKSLGLNEGLNSTEDISSMPHMSLLTFAEENRELYLAEPVPFVHLYESRNSLSYSNFEAHYANILMQQVLLREKIPYSILSNLDCLDKVKTIILPGTMCMSAEEIDKLVGFVKGGGGLVMTGNSGDNDEWYRGLDDQSLKARLGVMKKGAPSSSSVGKGKVAVFPRLSAKHDFNTYDWAIRAFEESHLWVKHHSWEAPDNMRQVSEAVRWTLDYNLPFTVNGALDPVICELTQSKNNMYLHLLNYDVNNAAKAITITFRDEIKSAEMIVPNTGECCKLKILPSNSVIIDELKIYAIVKVTI